MSTVETPAPPAQEPALRTIAMPADANANGDIFGGWVLSQMDLAGGSLAVQRATRTRRHCRHHRHGVSPAGLYRRRGELLRHHRQDRPQLDHRAYRELGTPPPHGRAR